MNDNIRPVQFSNWNDQFLQQRKEITQITNQIRMLEELLLKKANTTNVWPLVKCNIVNLLSHWVQNTSIGIQKPREFQAAFQDFACSLLELLKVMRSSTEHDMNSLASGALYQGTVYRYLGHHSGDYPYHIVEPEYNSLYVSWSKRAEIPSVTGELRGPITCLVSEISDNWYGIDLAAFGVSSEAEAEVLFPTVEECIKEVRYRASQ